ncbi:MAG: DinB family protein [Chloroflexia bacterium]
MYDTAKDLLDALRATPDTIGALLAGCTEEEAREARGGDENWSVVEVVCHLRDAQERAIERMRAMRDEEDPVLPSYDQEQWARERNYATASLAEAWASFLALQAAFVTDLEALPPSAWERTGRHEEQGRITISSHALHIISHDAAHTAQIARQLA